MRERAEIQEEVYHKLTDANQVLRVKSD